MFQFLVTFQVADIASNNSFIRLVLGLDLAIFGDIFCNNIFNHACKYISRASATFQDIQIISTITQLKISF